MDFRVPILAVASCGLLPGLSAEPDRLTSTAWSRLAGRSAATLAGLSSAATATPGIRDGDQQLGFNGFFGPVGDRGLDYAPALRALDGKVVAVTGHMVRDAGRPAGCFILAAYPVTIEQTSVCTQVDLPTAVIHVILDAETTAPAFRPGQLTLTGRLELGPRAEADGRNSCVRLIPDREAMAALFPIPLRSSP